MSVKLVDMRRKSWLLSSVLTGSVAIVATWIALRVYQIGDRAERQAMSVNYVYAACLEFVSSNREWPRSWDDLAGARPRVGMIEIPRDLEWVKSHVHVDFAATLQDIAKSDRKNFRGFGPRESPSYDYSGGYQSVIDAAKKALTGTNVIETGRTAPAMR